ncbi:MAG: Parvulin-like protein peptidyl-prolyl isomerase [Parcubacteria group bacterium GW2011_GWC2_42_6]|nr:MAG: Parvulin-like protein peptidyl-prolyl isomerase [Parcubacteria group bacterium GW2011_GWA2_42_11]KKS66993.1 MAG: Parvulin-like protein peptidyl-prolyl isomerase [Parcubacteria group bacterium GW2011_GWC2_42_6]
MTDNNSETTPAVSAPENNQEQKKKIVINKQTIIIAAIIVVVVAIGVLAYLYKGLFVAATVNGSPISRWSVIKELEKVSGKNALEGMINQKLIDDEAQKKEISISDDEISTEIKKIEEQLQGQGQTLDEALATQGMTLDDLKKRIKTQKQLEKLLADKTQVVDSEVDQYIKDNSVVIPAGQEASYRDQVKNQLEQEKLSAAAQTFLDSSRSQATIRYFVNY